MYAVLKTGGKQYNVSPGKFVRIDRIKGEVGEQVVLGNVLLAKDGDATKIGTPLLDGASVAAEIIEQGRDKKIDVFKKKRRNNYRRKKGHKQLNTIVKIDEILLDGKKPTAKKAIAKKATPKKAKENKAEVKKTAATKSSADKAEVKKPAATKSAADKAEVKKPAAKKSAADKAGAIKFLDKPNGDVDNLKKLSGVGKVLEQKLNDIGIYHFSQIAELKKDDIAKIDEALDLKGRFERDDWAAQAKELMK